MVENQAMPSGSCNKSCAQCRAACVPTKHMMMKCVIQARKTKAASYEKKEKTLVIEQYASAIRCPKRQKAQLKSLGLGKIRKTVTLPALPTIVGLVQRLGHLVRVVEK